MRPVAERFGRRSSAAAQRDWPSRDRIAGAIPVDDRHVIDVDQVWTVPPDFDCWHERFFGSRAGVPPSLKLRRTAVALRGARSGLLTRFLHGVQEVGVRSR